MSEWLIVRVADHDAETLDAVRKLFTEYHEWLGEVVCSARLAEEIAGLPGPYARPTGAVFLARATDGTALGCIGVRPHEATRAEIKRLYVRPAARGTGLGRALITTAIGEARELGYREALVSTLPETMPVAAAMYERLGFEETAPFFDHSGVGEDAPMRYLRLVL